MKYKHNIYILIIMAVLLLPLSSCMHMMMGGHDSHGEHQATAISKEIVSGGYTLSVSIDPMTVETEGKILLSLRSKSSLPESVAVHYMISKSSDTGSSSGHNHSSTSASKEEFKTIHQNILLRKGASTVLYTPSAGGNLVLTVEIEKLPNVESSLSMETIFMVHEKKSKGMMGMGGMMMGMKSEYWYLSALAMAGMMGVMWLVRSSF